MVCLAENTEKYKTFSVPIEEEVTRISKNGKEITKTISYRLQFTDCASFMASSLSNLADNLAEGIHEIRFKYGYDDEKCESCGIKYKDCDCCFEYTNVKLTKISISLSCCCQKEYEYMDNWEKFNETLPEKEVFYNHLNMEDITDADYAHAKRVSKDFKITNLGEYHALYVQSELLLLVDVFNNFQNMCLEICEVDLAHFVSALGLAW